MSAPCKSGMHTVCMERMTGLGRRRLADEEVDMKLVASSLFLCALMCAPAAHGHPQKSHRNGLGCQKFLTRSSRAGADGRRTRSLRSAVRCHWRRQLDDRHELEDE